MYKSRSRNQLHHAPYTGYSRPDPRLLSSCVCVVNILLEYVIILRQVLVRHSRKLPYHVYICISTCM